jgi:hypothetical protein
MDSMRRWLLTVLVALMSLPFITQAQEYKPPSNLKSPDMIAEGRAFFNQRCAGRCHGVDGQEGFDGPSLVAKAYLDPTFVCHPHHGRPGSAMPSWKGRLSDDELWRSSPRIVAGRPARRRKGSRPEKFRCRPRVALEHERGCAGPTMVLAAGFCVLFLGGGARFAIGLTLKSVVEEFGWGRSELGMAVALFQIVSAACLYVAGRLADRMSPRVVLGGGLAIAGVGIGLMSLMAAPWHALMLYGVVFAIGNGAASIIPVGVMVTRAFPRRTGLANAVVSSGMSVGQLVVISALAAVLVAIGWRSVYFWLGIAHLVLVPFLLLAIPAPGGGRGVQTSASPAGLGTRQAASTRQFWLLLGVYALCGLDDFFVSTHVVAFAQDRGLDPSSPATCWRDGPDRAGRRGGSGAERPVRTGWPTAACSSRGSPFS